MAHNTSVHKQRVFSTDDLQFASIRCRHCNTRVILDLEFVPKDTPGHQPNFTPQICPVCRTDYDTAAVSNLDSFHAIYKSLAALKGVISFHGSDVPAGGLNPLLRIGHDAFAALKPPEK